MVKSDVIISKIVKVSDNKQSVHARFMTDQVHINQQTNSIPYLYYYLGPSGKFISRQLIKKITFIFHLTYTLVKISYFYECV